MYFGEIKIENSQYFSKSGKPKTNGNLK